MLALIEKLAIICLDSIDDKSERKNVIDHIRISGKEILSITEEQVAQFARNMLQVVGKDNQRYAVMSQIANKSLSPSQIQKIEKESQIINSNLTTIEAAGGGVRCMVGEVFLCNSKI